MFGCCPIKILVEICFSHIFFTFFPNFDAKIIKNEHNFAFFPKAGLAPIEFSKLQNKYSFHQFFLMCISENVFSPIF